MFKSAKKKRQPQSLRLELLEDRCLLTAVVSIVTNPIAQTIVAGHTATFTAAATGSPTPTVQWEMSPAGANSFSPLSNNALFSGVNTTTLNVIGTTALNGDEFEAVFSNGVLPNPSVATSPATLAVAAATETPPTIGHMSNNNWTQGLVNFTGAMTISGGTAPFAISTYANLPPGVTPYINGDTIAFTGPPSVAQNFSKCTVTIVDADGTSATKTFVIDVEPAIIIGNLTQSQWTVGQPGFTGALTIAGGTGAYSLVSSSGLPAGLHAVVGGGTIHFTGVPLAVGTSANCSVTVADADGANATVAFAITINPAPTLSQLTTLQWTADEPNYPDTVTITGGTAPYTISSYAYMPFNTTVSGNTVYFTGAPPERVYYGATFTVQDAAGATVTQTNTISVNPVVTFSSLSVNQWTVGQPGFLGAVTFTYGTEPFTITSYSALPTGLTPTVSGDTLSFTGTPTVAGTFGNGNVALEDSGGEIFNVAVSITINPAPTFTTTALPIVTAGAGYGTTLKTKGGSGADTFTLTGGALPAGLTLQSNGHIGGTTNAGGTYSFTVTATDQTDAQTTQTFNIAVAPAISLGNLTQTQWTVGQAGFTGTIAIKGGDGSFTLPVAAGLPAGLTASLSGRTITFTGTPTAVGTSVGSITVVDSDGISASEPVSITINADPTLGSLAPTPWTAGQPGYPATITINGGTGPYTVVGSKGLPFNPVVSGNTILLTGSAGGAGIYSNGVIRLRDAAGAIVTADIDPIVINPAPTISHMSVNNWTEGAPNFPGALTINYGTGPFSIVTTRNVPLGLTPFINGNTIQFSGTPEVAQTVSSSITIRDAAGAIYTKIFVFDIAPPVMLITTHLPAWSSGVNYSTLLQATGGTGPLTFTLTGGSLPPGMILKSNGRIKGVATALGTFTFTVTVTDSIGAKASETFTL
jgi:hypothetical protein